MLRLTFAAVEGVPSSDAFAELGALTLSDWLWAGGLTLAAVIAAIVTFRLTVRLGGEALSPIVAKLLGRLAAGVVFVLGFFYALQQVGVSLAPILGLLGLLGLALALAFQEVLENFVAGVFLSARRPFSQGDEVTAADHEGIVEDITLRELTLRTYDGELVYIPNASVWSNPITNHTARGTRRTSVVVGVGYDTPLRSAAEILTEALRDVPGVEDDPAPQAYAVEFGDSSINYSLLFWHDASKADEWRVRNDVVAAVHEALRDADIDIPFPQRVVGFVDAPALTNGHAKN